MISNFFLLICFYNIKYHKLKNNFIYLNLVLNIIICQDDNILINIFLFYQYALFILVIIYNLNLNNVIYEFIISIMVYLLTY